tara:strand:+ start:261 stop:1406 length:1146 start_codon:yes stop_codon:yes gene_type:complete
MTSIKSSNFRKSTISSKRRNKIANTGIMGTSIKNITKKNARNQIKKTIRKLDQNKIDPSAIYSAPGNRFVTRVLKYLDKGGDNQIQVKYKFNKEQVIFILKMIRYDIGPGENNFCNNNPVYPQLMFFIGDYKRGGICLKQQFCGYDGKKSFTKSYIHIISKEPCGLKKENISGNFILMFADYLNKAFSVKVSKLMDKSTISINSNIISLRTSYLLKYGVTWYQKKGKFNFENKEHALFIEKWINKLHEIDVESYRTFLASLNIDNFGPITGNNEQCVEDLEIVLKILREKGIYRNSNKKLKNLLKVAMARENKVLNDEQKYILWNCLITVPNKLYNEILKGKIFTIKATKLLEENKENKIYRILHELINISKGSLEMEKNY